jgi:hypothetical protein
MKAHELLQKLKLVFDETKRNDCSFEVRALRFRGDMLILEKELFEMLVSKESEE